MERLFRKQALTPEPSFRACKYRQQGRPNTPTVGDSYDEGMAVRLKSRRAWLFCVAAIIATGILSRVVHTGFVVLDKYLGDALYAAMVYGILRFFAMRSAPSTIAACAMALMTALELFQLTMIPAHLLTSEHAITRICARLMGVEFGFPDLLAYAAGIGCIYLMDARVGPIHDAPVRQPDRG